MEGNTIYETIVAYRDKAKIGGQLILLSDFG